MRKQERLDMLQQVIDFYMQNQQFQIYFIKFWKLFLKLQYDSKELPIVIDVTQIPMNLFIYKQVISILKEALKNLEERANNPSIEDQTSQQFKLNFENVRRNAKGIPISDKFMSPILDHRYVKSSPKGGLAPANAYNEK